MYLTLAKIAIVFNGKANLYHLTSPICCLESKSRSIRTSHIKSYPHCSVYLLRKRVFTLFLNPFWSVYFKMKYSHNEAAEIAFPQMQNKISFLSEQCQLMTLKINLKWVNLGLACIISGSHPRSWKRQFVIVGLSPQSCCEPLTLREGWFLQGWGAGGPGAWDVPMCNPSGGDLRALVGFPPLSGPQRAGGTAVNTLPSPNKLLRPHTHFLVKKKKKGKSHRQINKPKQTRDSELQQTSSDIRQFT